MGFGPRQFQKLPGDRCGKDTCGKLGTKRPNKNPSTRMQHCRGSKTDLTRTPVPQSRASPSLHESERDGGKVWRERCLRGSGPALPCPRVLALTLLVTRSRGRASSFPSPQPYPSRRGVPSRGPRPCCSDRAGRRVLRGPYLACGGRAVGAGARRRSWRASWDGGDGPGRHRRRGAAPLLTTQLPVPHPGPPARARRPQLRDASLRRCRFPVHRTSFTPSPEYLQGSGLCLFLHILRFSSSSRPGANCFCFLFLTTTFSLSLHSNPGRPRLGAGPLMVQLGSCPPSQSHPLLTDAIQKLAFPTSFHPLLTKFILRASHSSKAGAPDSTPWDANTRPTSTMGSTPLTALERTYPPLPPDSSPW